MNKTPLNISICVVLYKAEEGSKKFHKEIISSLKFYDNWEIMYYDNSPDDKLCEPLSSFQEKGSVYYSHDPRNLGFSYANNILILKAKYNSILLLNPDVYGFSYEIWEKIRNLNINSGPRFVKLLNEDRSFQDCIGDIVSFKRAFSKRIDFSKVNAPISIGMGIMAFMLVEKSVFAKVGLLDCDYKLYAEDMDWCYRARNNGFGPVYEPSIELIHTGGASAKDRWSYKASILKKYYSEIVFINKHFTGVHWILMRALNAIKILKIKISF